MRPIRALLIYLALVFLGGALVAPWIYWLAQQAAVSQLISAKLAAEPFSRYVNRSLLVLALLGMIPLLRQLGSRSWRDVGMVNPAGHRRKILAGFALGFVSLALVAGAALLLGGRAWKEELAPARVITKAIGALATAGVVAVLEELLFRGGIFGGLRRALRWPMALTLSSALYAIVHFFARKPLSGEITWLSGFQQLGLMLGGFLDWHALMPGFVNLTLAGLLLGLAYQRTGNLWFSIGLHAGWIFWLKSYGLFTTRLEGANEWLWGSGKLIDGWVAGIVLTATFLVALRYLPRQKPQAPP